MRVCSVGFCNSIISSIFFCIGLGYLPIACAQAKWGPERNVEIVVGSTAGGSNDKIARIMQRVWQENRWLENITVVNKVGGGGSIAYGYVAQRAANPHYLTIARTALLSNHALGLSTLNYTDLTPIALIGEEAMAIAVRTDSPIKSINELVAKWKKDPQSVSISIGSARGSTTHFVLAHIARLSGVDPRKLKLITFGGSADSITNLLGGHIDVVSLAFNNLIKFHQAGSFRVIGVASEKRSALAPDVPTLKEQGYDVVVGGWFAVMAPRGIGAPQSSYWENMIERTVNHPEWKQFMESSALEWGYTKSGPTIDFLRKDYDAIRIILNDIGMAK